jgi:hypothetical protein
MAKKMPGISYYSVNDRQGNAGVMIEWGTLNGTLSPEEARTLGTGLIAASVEAEADASLLVFLRDGGSEPKAAEEIVENVARKRRAVRKARLTLASAEDA